MLPSETVRLRTSRRGRLSFPTLLLLLVTFSVALAADYTIQSGDTLWTLAQNHYGDASYWKALKFYNGIGNVYTIPNGTPINFPPKASLDQVNRILNDPSLTPAQKNSQVAALGGSSSSAATPNAGLGKPINYNALEALGLRKVPSL